MNKHFKDKVVWIVGASGGIGKAVALAMADRGAKLILSSRNKVKLEQVQGECKSKNIPCEILVLDLEKSDSFAELAATAQALFQRIDYLILNSGVSQRSYISETPLTLDRKIMEINYFGNIALTKAILPIMLQQKSGHIAVVSSIVGIFGFPLRSAYSASKHALHGFYETLRTEHQQDGLKISIIIPGRVKTQISENALTQNGEAYGQLDPGQANGIKAQEAAKIIVKGIQREKKEIMVGKKEIWMVYIRRYSPMVFYKIANSIKKK